MDRRLIGVGLAVVMALAAAVPAGAYWIKECSYGNHFSSQTAMVADINPGPDDAAHALFGFGARGELITVYQGAIYFPANDGKAGAELWRSAGALYFARAAPNGGQHVWRFDGTSAQAVTARV